ncbi:YihY/virulence factor BrkB family protein [Candidatus Woesebacteria bacterium]|nr:YihY/virulence factor BrkB family protein [Candidatus Woesebacteria bacterium]
MHQIYLVFLETLREFKKYNISQMAASLAYFGLFATAPIIVITISILNIFLSDIQIRYELLKNVQTAAGPQVATTVNTVLINNSNKESTNFVFETITIATLIIAATTLFIQLQNTINTLWNIHSIKPTSLLTQLRTRFFSLLAIIIAGISLYILFAVSILINLAGGYFQTLTGYHPWIIQNINFMISFFFIIAVITCIFKYIPEAYISWLDALVGGTVTAVFFTIGRYLLTFYFSKSVLGSIYGTAGSLLVFLAWIYFSAIIFLFGAKLTQIHAQKMGEGVHAH